MTTIDGEQFIEIVIVGGSIAGSALALRLLQAGRKVCLIDREQFPRSKSCGEGLSAAGLAELESLGVLTELKQLPHGEYRGYEVELGGKFSSIPSLPVCGVTSPLSYGVRRSTLDTLVLNQIRHHENLLLLEGAAVKALHKERGEFVISAGDYTIRSTFLVAADGANSKVGSLLRATPLTEECELRYALSLWYSAAVPLDRILIVIRDGYEIFFTPVGDCELNCSILSDTPEPISRDREELLTEIESIIASRFGITLPDPHLLRGISLCPGLRRESNTRNLIFIGDAAEAFDPISGMGMTHALVSARLAAECLLQAHPELDNESLFLSYQAKRAKISREFRAVTKIVSLLLKRLPPVVANPALSSARALLSLSPALKRGAIQLLSGVMGG